MKEISRKVKKRRAKDYLRDAKYYDWYYIVYNNRDIGLNLNGWSEWLEVLSDNKGKYTILENNLKCYLDFD